MFVNPSGGLYYHWSAMRFERKLWRHFKTQLALWIHGWKPQSPKLLLVGPSAGYCLPRSFIHQFEQIDVLEIDPLARYLARFRYDNWHIRDYFKPENEQFSIDKIDHLLANFPDHAILFCNLLGQLPLLYPQATRHESYATWRSAFFEKLKSREFASFHDRFSSSVEFELSALDFLEDLETEKLELKLSDSKSLEEIFNLSRIFPRDKNRPRSKFEVYDHLTNNFFPGLTKKYVNWHLRPKQHHLIEMVHSGC